MVDERRDFAEKLLAAYALNALDEEERTSAERLVEEEPAYREVLSQYQEAADYLGLAQPLARPSALLKTRIMAAVAHEGQRSASRRWPLHWPIIPTVAAAALVMALVGVGAFAMLQRNRAESLETEVAELQESQRELVDAMLAGNVAAPVRQVAAPVATPMPAGVAPLWGPRGMLLINRQNRQAILTMTSMEPLGPDEVYQVWLWDTLGNTHSIATFAIDQAGYAKVPLVMPEDMAGIKGISVSVEPVGGSAAPTGLHILAGEVRWPQ